MLNRRRLPPVAAPWSRRELWVGMALALLFYVVGSLSVLFLVRRLGLENSPWLGPILLPVHLAMLLPPLRIMARYGSPWRLLGLDRFDRWMLLEAAVALGLGYCSAIAWGLFLLPFGVQAQEPLVPLFGEGVGALVSALVVASLLAPLVEEVVFRGFLFGGLRARLSPGWAAVVSGAIFGAVHLQPYAFPVLFLLGVLLALLYHRSGSLWPAILMHFCINFFAVLVQYVALSQGLI